MSLTAEPGPQCEGAESGNGVTADEAALYDRQIRLWGFEAQSNMRTTRVLVYGLNGVIAEAVKNIVLAGVGHVHIVDDQEVTHEVLAAQFFLTEASVGKNRAEASRERIHELNPRVKLTTAVGGLSSLEDPALLQQFDIACISTDNLSAMKQIDEACRTHNVRLFITRCHGSWGWFITDLKGHTYKVDAKKTTPGPKQSEQKSVKLNPVDPVYTLDAVPSVEAIFIARWDNKSMRRTKKLFFGLSVLLHYLDSCMAEPTAGGLLEYKAGFVQRMGKQPDFVSDEELLSLWNVWQYELSPVAAVVGGFVGQEILKIASHKDEPLQNVFLFSGLDTYGTVELIGDQ